MVPIAETCLLIVISYGIKFVKIADLFSRQKFQIMRVIASSMRMYIGKNNIVSMG